MRATWVLTLVSPIVRAAAISALERPRATCESTSTLRAVRRRNCSGLAVGRRLTYHHTGDYWYTGIGLPTAAAAAVLLFALRALQPQARPRLTLAGAILNAAVLALLFAMLSASIAAGAEARRGGTYVVGTLASFVGHGLFVAGTWRTGLFPRPLLAVWPVVWLIGAFAAQGVSPLLLAAFYIALAVLVTRRT